MASDADKALVTLTLVGTPEHHGHVMARALVEKLDQFLSTFAGFERAFLGSRVRQTDFEVAALTHNSPTAMRLHPVPRVKNYQPMASVDWTLDQWERIVRGEKPDGRIDDDLVSNVISLAGRTDHLAYSIFHVSYGKRLIKFDENALANAEAVRLGMRAAIPALPWRSGLSRGSLTGELRSAMDENGEKQTVVRPFVGPERVNCKFPESLRDQVKVALWGIVRLTGLRHYSNESPHPFLIDIEEIQLIDVPDDAPHFVDASGLFKDAAYPLWVDSAL